MKNKEAEIILREDGFYQITLVYPKDKLRELILDGYGYDKNLAWHVTEKLAEKYMNENYTELKKLIDLDLVKLLATRKLAGIVASEK